ncbi:MAG: NUDIX domain-containing protein [Francisellaceae bacterium]|jgi:8-oxo-dGTP diphosphatase|nr:NUDIX domain-containing protein [Francisellaceae bacterium]
MISRYLDILNVATKSGESPELAIVRELNEELGAKVEEQDLIFLGAVTEKITEYSELVYHYFWKDTKNTITGCYECAPKYYSNPKEAMEHHKIMDDVVHLLKVCEEKGFV